MAPQRTKKRPLGRRGGREERQFRGKRCQRGREEGRKGSRQPGSEEGSGANGAPEKALAVVAGAQPTSISPESPARCLPPRPRQQAPDKRGRWATHSSQPCSQQRARDPLRVGQGDVGQDGPCFGKVGGRGRGC